MRILQKRSFFASLFITLGIILGWNSVSHANACGEMIYNKNGKLRKYQYMPNTISENSAKHGSSTSSGVSTEMTTAGSDVGVSTGATAGYGQFSSTKGECKWFGLFSSHQQYHDYLAQNLTEIKQEMSLGKGGHLQILASAFECNSQGQKQINQVFQKNFGRFVDFQAQNADQFAKTLNDVVDTELAESCHAI